MAIIMYFSLYHGNWFWEPQVLASHGSNYSNRKNYAKLMIYQF